MIAATVDAFVVRRSAPLSGTIRVWGAKNSALKLLAAALLSEGRTTLRNVPDIADVHVMADVVRSLGVQVTTVDDVVTLDVPGEVAITTPPELVSRLRASIIVLGPLLAREGRAVIAAPGGCNLGSRAIDMHLDGLRRLGAEVRVTANRIEATADRLVGADVELPFPSVGATENILLAAVRAEGVTCIRNAAREPEIADLAAFLSAMGADITGAGTSDIVVRGVGALAPADHAVVGDRIEAGTYAVAAAVTGGEVKIDGVDPRHLSLPLAKLAQMGAEVEACAHHVVVRASDRLRAVDVATLPFPGFPTDLQPQMLVLLTQASGSAMLTENVFDGRFSVVDELVRMGADLEVEGHHAVVRGPTPLHGAVVRAPDLRAGAALVVAGLAAEGVTIVVDPQHVDRGYADLAGRLRLIGGDVRRCSVEDPAAVVAAASPVAARDGGRTGAMSRAVGAPA